MEFVKTKDLWLPAAGGQILASIYRQMDAGQCSSIEEIILCLLKRKLA